MSTTRPADPRRDDTRSIRAPRGSELVTGHWAAEAPLRMLMNNLDAEVAESPTELVVYGGIGRAARNWEAYDRIVETLKRLKEDETLLVQSGKPVGVFRTHAMCVPETSPDPVGSTATMYLPTPPDPHVAMTTPLP